jgi:hypothetical protein
METGVIEARGYNMEFSSSEQTQWHGMASKKTPLISYSCKACGYVEIYRDFR